MATTLYFAPTYFAPTYFPTDILEQPSTTAATRYFAPTYFATTYFYPYTLEQSSTVSTPPGPHISADRLIYAAILDSLEATNAFESVLFASAIDRLTLGSAATPLVALVPDGWEEFDEVDPTSILRRVSFYLDLLVRDEDAFGRFEQLDALESAARGAIEGLSLAGISLPGLTRLRRARYDAHSLPPEQSARLEGEFTYIIAST
jgi:hypothetical protein